MHALTETGGFWVLMMFGLFVLYVLPSLIGAVRRVEDLGWLVVINLLPTGVGWLAALIGAFMLPRREPSRVPVPRPAPRRVVGSALPGYVPAETRHAYADALELLAKADEESRRRQALAGLPDAGR